MTIQEKQILKAAQYLCKLHPGKYIIETKKQWNYDIKHPIYWKSFYLKEQDSYSDGEFLLKIVTDEKPYNWNFPDKKIPNSKFGEYTTTNELYSDGEGYYRIWKLNMDAYEYSYLRHPESRIFGKKTVYTEDSFEYQDDQLFGEEL